MTITAEVGLRIVDSCEDGRIYAVDAADIEIVGAYPLQDRDDWILYTTRWLAGRSIPHPAYVPSRESARRWVELIASLHAGAAMRLAS